MIFVYGLSMFSNKIKNAIDLDIKIDFVQYSTEKLTYICQAICTDPSTYELRDLILQEWPKSCSSTKSKYWETDTCSF